MIKQAAKRLLKKAGFQISRIGAVDGSAPLKMEPGFGPIYKACAPFTMTSPERMYALYQAVQFTVGKRHPGAIVECGVWRGGSSMLIASTLMQMGETGRDIYLFDTYEGMPKPDSVDVDLNGVAGMEEWSQHDGAQAGWLEVGIEEVRRNMASIGYPKDRIHLVKGKVEDTIPLNAPGDIALLRLDTDWYASTYHELLHLFPKLASGGVLLIDDYGHWQGAKKAVDEYFAKSGDVILLNRIDSTGRIGLKA